MSRGTVNKVILIGRLGQEPEIRSTQGGKSVGNLNLATTRSWKKDDAWVEETSWHRVVLWGNDAENAGKYLHKGSRVCIEGRLQTRSWDDQEGKKQYVTEVVCENMQFLDSKEQQPAAPVSGDQDTNVPF